MFFADEKLVQEARLAYLNGREETQEFLNEISLIVDNQPQFIFKTSLEECK